LIVAIHDLLAEHGLCCAGEGGEGEEGTFLKFAIKQFNMMKSFISRTKHLKLSQYQIHWEWRWVQLNWMK
jgi:hypothetical protein